MRAASVWLSIWLVAAVAPGAAHAADALIAVATNFAKTAEAIAPLFESRTGHTLTFASGSTGKLHAQIDQGAPFDALLSADALTPARIEAAGHAVSGTRFTYAVGRLVLWSPDAARVREDGVASIRDPAVRHIAIANPHLAPYGLAARDTLLRLGLWDEVQPKLVRGQNVGQAHALVAAGAAEIGFVARSQLTGPNTGRSAEGQGSRWNVPAELHDPIRQDAVLLSAGADNDAARAFLAHLRSPEVRDVITGFGYEAP